jgi:hypothetical protein
LISKAAVLVGTAAFIAGRRAAQRGKPSNRYPNKHVAGHPPPQRQTRSADRYPILVGLHPLTIDLNQLQIERGRTSSATSRDASAATETGQGLSSDSLIKAAL